MTQKRMEGREGNLSLVEAARIIGISPHTLRDWAKYQRRVPYIQSGRHSRLLFAPADIDHFLETNRVEARPEPVER